MHQPGSQMDLLSTKLHPPPLREKRVVRERLLHTLDASLDQRLTLVCAPAGYGKTTLLRQWVERRPEAIGWVSLDRSDNDPAQFLRYFTAALQCIDPTAAGRISEMLQHPQPPSGPAVWVALLNDVAASKEAITIILDDYQEVEARPVHEAVEYLVEHAPDNLHLILAARADPPLSLPRLRARGHLTELRQSDLCFSAEEAADFLNNVMGLELSAKDVAALEARTEGWIAALQMAALSLRGHSAHPLSRSEFVQAFTGSHRFVLDYLVEEVLEQQPPALQEFLIKTSILERLSGPLCDAVLREREIDSPEEDKRQATGTPGTGSQSILEHLEAANLFIVPLDDERRWYRYHRLFSDLLRKRLLQASPDGAPALHRRASAWHEQQGLIAAAIDHALAAHDFARAAGLIEDNAEATLMRSEVMTFLNWVERLPDEKVRSRPTLCFLHAWGLLMSGRPLNVVEQRLQEVADLSNTPEGGGIAAGRMAALRAYLTVFQADIQRAAELCRQALELLPASDRFLRNVVAWILSLARLSDGDLQDGKLALEEVIRTGQEIGNPLIAVAALCHQARLQTRQGRLPHAKETLEQALQMATDSHGQRLPVASEALIGLGELKREWNDLEAAADDLTESIQLAGQWSDLAAFDAYFPLALTRLAQGDAEGGREALDTARQIARRSEITQMDDLIADLQEASFFAIQGELAEAMRRAEKWDLASGVSPEPRPGIDATQEYVEAHVRKYQHLVWARLFILQDRPADALELLETLLAQARQLKRIDLIIEVQILRALAFQLDGQGEQALEALAEALSLAEPGGYVRIFLDEGEPMARLLRRGAGGGLAPAYVTKLLAAFGGTEPAEPIHRPEPSYEGSIIEPLSERELEALRLLATGMSNPEIAGELVIAVSTVHSHIKSIYGKLGVHKRWDAVQRARELGLI